MQKVTSAVLGVLRFLGISLLLSLGLFVLVSLSCLIGTRCSNAAYSERMFWVGFAVTLCAMPGVLSVLGSHQGYYSSPFTAGMDAQVTHTIAQDAHRSLNKRTAFTLRAISVGLMGIGLAALIDILG